VRRLGIALEVDALRAEATAEERVVLPPLVVLLRRVALGRSHPRFLLRARDLVLAPPAADAIEEAHDGKCLTSAGRSGTIAAMDADRARELLATERARIERALGRHAHEDTGRLADDEGPGDVASDLYQDELDEGLSDDLREQLAAVERAEARLAAGTYGLSIESGQPIPDERLEAVPTAERTTAEEARR